MNIHRYGASNGAPVIYFHGAPGAPDEGRIFDSEGKRHGVTFICIDRFSVAPSLRGDAYYKRLADAISTELGGSKADFVGFSIGAFVALQTCRFMPGTVKSLHLISAAAPLEAGDFLDHMAGKPVFRLAKAAPFLFLLLAYWQGLLVLLLPKAVFRLLFSSAAGADKALAVDPGFQTFTIGILKFCFKGGVRGYARDIASYVQPWKNTLANLAVNTHIWHGTEDNWSPPLMAEYLKSALSRTTTTSTTSTTTTTTTMFSGLSHYSSLYRAAPEICSLISGKN